MSSIEEILLDPVLFIVSFLKVINKKGSLVSLLPMDEQVEIIRALETGEDVLELKARQIGSSTIVVAWLFYKAYVSREPVTMGLMSHKSASAKHLLKMAKIMHTNMPAFLRRKLSVDTTTEFRFDDTGAGLIAVSAEGKGGLRSFTCTKLMISEFAFAPQPAELKATAISAVNDGQLIIETTANYFGDAMHKEIMLCLRGEADWKYLFFPWFTHANYNSAPPDDWTPEADEKELQRLHRLTDAQLYWRNRKISKVGREKFKREYPSTMEEAYTVAGNTYLKEEDFHMVDVIPVEPSEVNRLADPDTLDRYAIGVDVAAGVGRDYSVVQVVSKMTGQQVYIYRSNVVSPVQLASIIVDIGYSYNEATVLVEANNMGAVVLSELRNHGYGKLWIRDGRDWTTTLKSKTEMFENMKRYIQEDRMTMVDSLTHAELRAITVTERGYIELPEVGDGHGDSAVALALCLMCLTKVRLSNKGYLPSWVTNQRAAKKRRNGAVGGMNNRKY